MQSHRSTIARHTTQATIIAAFVIAAHALLFTLIR